jgi:DNA invertase Pin-like site-specific DNA recombinase
MSRQSSKVLKQCWLLYCRKSTDDGKKQRYTLEDQEAMGREYYDNLPEEERKDRPLIVMPHEAKSAFSPDNRDVFDEMMAMIERKEVYGIIAAQSNRISRNPKETGIFIGHLISFKLKRFDACVDKRVYRGNDSNAIFMLGIECGMACKDSSDKGQRMSSTTGRAGSFGESP